VSSPRPVRWLAGLLLALALSAAAALPAEARGSDPPQLQALKAGFLFNFARFTSWPAEKRPRDLVRFCPLRGSLAPQLLADWGEKRIGGQRVDVRILAQDLERLEDCHVVFGSDAVALTAPATRDRALAAHVLLVSDAPGFASAGGHIGLIEDGGRLRFQVNLAAVRAAGLKLSARMLRLARVVAE
jgi:hypothetical protein